MASPVLRSREGLLPSTCWQCFFFFKAKILMASLTARVHCWLMVSWLFRTAYQLVDPLHYWCMRLFLLKCKILHLPLLNCIRLLLGQFSNEGEFNLSMNGSSISWSFRHPSQFCMISKFLKLMWLHPFIQIINEDGALCWPQNWSLGYLSSDW